MIYIIITRVIYLFIHELSHVLALKIRHLKIKEFKIYGLCYDGRVRKWSFRIKEFDFAGYVVPWITYDIDTDIKFSEFKTAYMFSLLAGPLFPFGIFFIMYAMGEVIQVPVKFLAITFLINVILMLLSSLVGNKDNMGDIQAVLFFSSDSNLAIQLLEDLPLLKEKVNENEITYLNEKASIACNLPKL